MATIEALNYDEDAPTAKQCGDCKGEGFLVVELGTFYRGEECKRCRGSGREPVLSGTFNATR